MRIAVVCNDTRGGVQPYVALALGLRKAGHDVRAVAPGDLASMFSSVGLSVVRYSGSVEEVLRNSPDATGKGTLASVRFAARESLKYIGTWTKETLEACDGVDVLTGGIGGMMVGGAVAEKLGKPFIEAHLQPIGAVTDAYPGVLLAGTPRWLGGWATRLSHRLSELALWLPFKGAVAAAREQVLGLTGRAPPNTLPVLYGFSRHVVPLTSEGPRARHVTGYWWLPMAPTWSPPQELEAFLSRGGPVVSIGFGSMPGADPVALTALVLGAVRSIGARAVLVAGWGGLQSKPQGDDVCCVETVPYEWLFPRVAAIVHHGGAGTTGEALRSGVPSLVVPFIMDQPFWGARTAALGAGPAPIPHRRLTQERLAKALRRMLEEEEMKAKAAALGLLIRAEDGVSEAVAHFSRLAPA